MVAGVLGATQYCNLDGGLYDPKPNRVEKFVLMSVEERDQ